METAVQHEMHPGTPAVIARPPVIFLSFLMLGFILDHVIPPLFAVSRFEFAHKVISATPILIGLAILMAGIRNFRKSDTPVPTVEPSRALVTDGIYKWTRNPIYLGMFFIYVGIGLAARSPSILLLAPALAVTIRYGVVSREEIYLEQRFGDTYRNYKTRVRRWG